jgi:hypothetical protein
MLQVFNGYLRSEFRHIRYPALLSSGKIILVVNLLKKHSLPVQIEVKALATYAGWPLAGWRQGRDVAMNLLRDFQDELDRSNAVAYCIAG